MSTPERKARRARARSAIVCVALLAAAAPAAAEGRTALAGRVVDVTCYGPCTPESDPRPYTGPAEIVIRARDGDRVATVPTEDGRFRKRVAPGRYRVTVKIAGPCWEGERRLPARVARGEVERVRPAVENVCIR
jgi:hypothetical protein